MIGQIGLQNASGIDNKLWYNGFQQWGWRKDFLGMGQDLGTVLRCCSLDSPLKILLCRFFVMKLKYIF